MQDKKINWKTWAKRLFLLLVAVFLIRYFYRNLDDYRNLDLTIDWGIFGLAVLFYFAYKLTLSTLWHYLTVLNDCGIELPAAITAYLYSILGKYIPGKVFMLVARIPAYQERGRSISKVTVCFFLENICTILGAGLLFLVSLFFFPNELLEQYRWAAVLLVIAFFICIHPKIINFFLGILERWMKRDNLHIPITYPQMLRVVALFFGNWLIVGIGFYILSCSIYRLPLSQMLYAAGVFGISCIIGILAIFAPSGIGVREGILTLGLGLLMPTEYAVIIAIVSRLWMSVSELVLIAIAWILQHIKKPAVILLFLLIGLRAVPVQASSLETTLEATVRPSFYSVAHRGYDGKTLRGKNLLSSFEGAKEHGFNAIECDVAETKDHKLVLSHSGSFRDSVTREKVVIRKKTLKQLRKYSYYGSTIATFEELVKLCKNEGLFLYVDKLCNRSSAAVWKRAFDIVSKYQMGARVTWIVKTEAQAKRVFKRYSHGRAGIIRSNTKHLGYYVRMANRLKTKKNSVCIFVKEVRFSPKILKKWKKKLKSGVTFEVWVINGKKRYKKYLPYVSGVASDKYCREDVD